MWRLGVYDFTGQVIGALAVSGPAWRLSLQGLREKSMLLQVLAERLSAELGYRQAESSGQQLPFNPATPHHKSITHLDKERSR